MKKFVFSVASWATGRLQIKPSGSGDENARDAKEMRNTQDTRTGFASCKSGKF